MIIIINHIVIAQYSECQAKAINQCKKLIIN